ncbi:MAG: YqeG family HAD IIIA-type phosphatase [Tenericutes bacterium]|nr:YqeG family HAD IIIA-type phosphatase [Mycoplasmatota bacterium]
MLENFIPDIYQKSIYYINYDKLLKKGIRCIIFDLDNTITPCHINKPTKRLKRLFDELKEKGFKVIIMSNAPKYRIEPFKSYLEVDACAFSLKPKKDKYIKVLERYKYKHTEVAAIGDQFLTDILGANRMDITSVLVNPLTHKDYSVTMINRLLEKFILNKLAKKELFRKGKYYD